ncbi:MAG TPA: CAP domain-containing protein [Solirubrobacteraceae bacterium]|nr:CAP domain-containing protein [Solirubrobacteraceae bacterium]
MTRMIVQFTVLAVVALALASPADAAVRLDRGEHAAIRHINAFRAHHGRPAVHPLRALNRAAESHSFDMATRHFFSHTSSNGTPFDLRIRRFVRKRAVGEALAWHTSRRGIARVIVGMWIASPPHRAILLEGRFRRIGIARRHGMWTADFASRR